MKRPAFDMVKAKEYTEVVGRLLSHASPAFISFYSSRYKDCSQYRGAIIFPETILSLKQKKIWSVGIRGSKGDFSIIVSSIEKPKLMWKHREITSLEELQEYEQSDTPDEISLSSQQMSARNIKTYGYTPWLELPYLFTNKRDAKKFIMKATPILISQLAD